MNAEFKTILDQFSNLIERWNAKEIPNQAELVEETRNLNAKLTTELRNPQKEQTSIPPAGE